MSRQSSRDAALEAALSGPVEQLGLVLEEVALTPAGSRRVLRVVVDVATAEGSLSLDDVAAASRAVSEVLDARDDLVGGAAYTLEVTSPGVERPLTLPRQFRRNARRTVAVTLRDGSEVTGRVTAADDALVLDVPGPQKGMRAERVLAWDDVVRGQVQVEFTAVRPQDDLTEPGPDGDPHDPTDESED